MNHLNEILTFINSQEMLAYDTETTGLNTRKDKVIGFGISNATVGYYIPIWCWDSVGTRLYRSNYSESDISTILTALHNKKLIMFNASFDARITRNDLKIDLLPSLHTDVLLLKHTCDEEFPFGLKEIAAKLWGHDVKKEKDEMQASIKANSGSAKEYYKADTELLGRYCIQDCLLTFKLYNHYKAKLQQQGLEDFYYVDEVLPLYKEVTIPMEDAGVRVDLQRLTQTNLDLKIDIKKLERSIISTVHPHLGPFMDWFRNKEYPFKATGRVGKKMKSTGAALEVVQYGLMQEDYPDGAFNLQSKHHLKKLFFDGLGCTPLSTTPTGMPQVDEEFMLSIVSTFPWVQSLIDYNKLQKINSTYIERFINEQEEGRFYPSFMQHRTVSGRYAGDLQQLPRPVPEDGSIVARYTNRIREFFVSDSDCMLVSADYEQLEPTIFAHTSGDPALQAIFNEGKDFYSTVAISTENLSGVSADKKADNYLGTINKGHRQRAKIYSLGIAYGMTGYKLQFELGCSNEEADLLVRKYLDAFPRLAAWMEESKKTVRKTGSIATQSGRVRHLNRAKSLFERYGMAIENDLSLWKNYHHNPSAYASAKLDRKEYKNLMNNAINFQVQGLAASIVNRAAIRLARALRAINSRAKIIMQVHDELVLNVPAEELGPVCDMTKDIMQSIVELAVPLKTVPQWGNNFRECK